MKGFNGFLIGLAAVWFAAPAAALVPLSTPIQGVVRDGAGVPVADAHFGMTFTLYTGPGEAADEVWSEAWPPDGGDCLVDTEGCVHVAGGRFRVLLGAHNPLSPDIFAVGPLWLGVRVEEEPELPRRPLGSSPYAHRAAVAGSVDCTGCVGVDALSDGARQALVDEALEAVETGGYPTAEDLANLDLAQISNGTLTNAFTHVAASPEPVEILDINPGGVGSHVVTPDLGFIEAARVSAHVTNSDLSTLKFQLFTLDQETGTIVLYDQGLEGTEIQTTWPTEMTPVEGTFDTLVGKPTDGVWVFHVTDQGSPVGEGLSPKDGAIVSWSLELDVVGGDQVIVHGQAVVNGDLQVKGETTMEGDAQVKGDLEVGGVLSGPGGIVVGAGEPTCDGEHAGAMHYDPQLQRLVFCDGQKLLQLRACEAICPGPEAIACGEPVLDGCGAPCGDSGTGLSTVQCATNATAVPCGDPVADACDNDCGTQGLALAAALCEDGALVPCGDPITDPCGNPCGGVGSFCGPGFQCADQEACQAHPGTSAESAVQSCQGVLDAGTFTDDGVYWLDTDGAGPAAPFEAWCDMEPNGAWMLSYIMCQDGGGDARAGGLNHETPIKPDPGSPVSSLGFAVTEAMGPTFVRLTSTHTGGMGYLFPWSEMVQDWNPAQTLLDGTMGPANNDDCSDLGPSAAGSTGAQCGGFSIQHNNGGPNETHDIPTLACHCPVWVSDSGMLWGQIDGLGSYHGVSHRDSLGGFPGGPQSGDGCLLLYVK